MLESTLQKRIIQHLQTIPSLFMVKTIHSNKRGIPDILACYKGYFIFIEIKSSPKAQITPLQNYTINTLLQTGAHGFITYSFPHYQYSIFTLLQTLDNLHNITYNITC